MVSISQNKNLRGSCCLRYLNCGLKSANMYMNHVVWSEIGTKFQVFRQHVPVGVARDFGQKRPGFKSRISEGNGPRGRNTSTRF